MNASNSSSEWKCVICPETTCSTRPSQAQRGPGGLGAQLHHKGPIGRERQWGLGHRRPPATPRLRRGIFALFVTCQEDTIRSPFQTRAQAFKLGGAMPGERFENCASCSRGRHDGTRAPHCLALSQFLTCSRCG